MNLANLDNETIISFLVKQYLEAHGQELVDETLEILRLEERHCDRLVTSLGCDFVPIAEA